MKITSLINDLIDLMGVQSQGIEHYRQYSLVPIFIINLLLVAVSSVILDSRESLALDLVISIALTLINVIFLMYWFGRVNIKHSFLTFLHFDIVLGIAAHIPYLAILVVMNYFDSMPLIGFLAGLSAICYVIYMVSLNYAQATKSLDSYAFIGVLIVITFQFVTELLLI